MVKKRVSDGEVPRVIKTSDPFGPDVDGSGRAFQVESLRGDPRACQLNVHQRGVEDGP
jgi:hypothetical protein